MSETACDRTPQTSYVVKLLYTYTTFLYIFLEDKVPFKKSLEDNIDKTHNPANLSI